MGSLPRTLGLLLALACLSCRTRRDPPITHADDPIASTSDPAPSDARPFAWTIDGKPTPAFARIVGKRPGLVVSAKRLPCVDEAFPPVGEPPLLLLELPQGPGGKYFVGEGATPMRATVIFPGGSGAFPIGPDAPRSLDAFAVDWPSAIARITPMVFEEHPYLATIDRYSNTDAGAGILALELDLAEDPALDRLLTVAHHLPLLRDALAGALLGRTAIAASLHFFAKDREALAAGIDAARFEYLSPFSTAPSTTTAMRSPSSKGADPRGGEPRAPPVRRERGLDDDAREISRLLVRLTERAR